MIKVEKAETYGWGSAIRGMRNPMISWDNSDSSFDMFEFIVGDNDYQLMKKLVKAGEDHAKFMRMINVSFDITAPRLWFHEFDTYKVGTVSNSCSTMHTIHKKPFTIDDFSYDNMSDETKKCLSNQIVVLNKLREKYIATSNKQYWEDMIYLLPQSYNQKRTVTCNYAVLRNMYHARKNHRLKEWRDFCKWMETLLPYSELITLER